MDEGEDEEAADAVHKPERMYTNRIMKCICYIVLDKWIRFSSFIFIKLLLISNSNGFIILELTFIFNFQK